MGLKVSLLRVGVMAILGLWSALLLMAAEAKTPDAHTTIALLKVNGQREAITLGDVTAERLVNSQFLTVPTTPSLKREYAGKLTEQAAYRTLVYLTALKRGEDRDTTVRQMLEGELGQFLVQQLRAELAEKLPEPSEAQIVDYYRSQPGRFEKPETYSIQYIFAYYENAADTQAVGQAKQRAEEARGRLLGGEAFESVARALSFSPSGNQGEPIQYSPGSLNPQLESLVASLKDGDLSEIMAVDSGFVIVRRLSHTPASTIALVDARPTIRGILQRTAESERWESFYQEKLKEYQPQLNGQVLKQAVIPAEAPVFRFADQSVTYGQVQRELEAIRSLPADKFNAQITELFKNRLLEYAARQRGLHETAIYQEQRRRVLRDLLYDREQSRLLRDLAEKVVISDQESADFYARNRQYFVSERETRLQVLRILTATTPTTESALVRKGAAFKTAQSIRQRMTAGEDPEKLMAKVNGDWKGAWDFAPYGPRGHVIDLTVEKLKLGEVSQPVEHKDGFYIIRVAEDRPSRPLEYEQVRDKIEDGLRYQKATESVDLLKQQHLHDAQYTPIAEGIDAVVAVL